MAKSSIDVEVQVLSETAERLILRWIYGKRYRDLTAEELWLCYLSDTRRFRFIVIIGVENMVYL